MLFRSVIRLERSQKKQATVEHNISQCALKNILERHRELIGSRQKAFLHNEGVSFLYRILNNSYKKLAIKAGEDFI